MNQMPGFSDSMKQHRSKKGGDLELYMSNCFVEDPSIKVPLEVKVQPEMCGSFSVSFANIIENYNITI